MKHYPLRKWTQLLRLWHWQTDLDVPVQGPAVAGRLKGAALQFAPLSDDRLDIATGELRTVRAPELFIEPACDTWVNPANGQLFEETPSGVQVLVRAITAEFRGLQQDL